MKCFPGVPSCEKCRIQVSPVPACEINDDLFACVNGCRFSRVPSVRVPEISSTNLKRILFSDEVHFWLNGYVNKQNCRIWSEANPQVYVETPLHPEKLTVWRALWAGGTLLQKR
ncbi:DUF4817 domain-containing protein [Trichonephila clavipes]|nr:DUF4817 domain-containing protein [Trichonephila clavipes]